ncbi:translation initiation factor IF-5A [Candidatus Pacearchaeota archaeon]|nr:translation initiation factor IF-5A [Candidatus Pacearchaeota archaeon]
MVLKLIDAHGAKPGTTIMIEGETYTVRSNDISKSGKHGASKCRIEAVNIITGNKKVLACPGAERFEVPMIEKKKAQILSLAGDKASVMDLESYETIEIPYLQELKDKLLPEKQVEYWDIEGKKIIMRVL